MSLTPEEAADLADLLPDELSCNNARERLLCLVEMLRSLTDEAHALSNAEIRAVLQARFGPGCTPAENTIAADIRAIRDSGCLGLAVHVTPAGTWCESSRFSPARVRLLLNAVQASRFLTSRQNAELQESLLNLVSRHQEETLERQVLVERRVRKSYQEVFDTCDVIAQALNLNRKVEFSYTYNDFEGRPHVLESDSGETIRRETPIALLFSEGNYYLESYAAVPWRHGVCVTRSRVDRMYETRVSDERADQNEEVAQAKRDAKRRQGDSFSMVDGPTRLVFLRVRADYTNVMIDRFGYDLRYAGFHGKMGDVGTTALTCVRVAQSFTFFRWLTSAGGGIVIERPPSWAASLKPWAKLLADVDHERLERDYEAVRDGYLAFLDRARGAVAT